MISVIIPVYNEEAMLRKNDIYYQSLSPEVELIFVDGGSEDKTLTLAGQWGRVIKARKNRAAQMNAGARVAKGKMLLFLHADAVIEKHHLERLEEVVKNKKLAGGCFTQTLDQRDALFKWIAFTGNVRAKTLKIFYGDQGIFIRRAMFRKLGGFPEVKICEDVLFTKKLRAAGKVDILPFPVHCSARRWKKQGIMKTFIMNVRIHIALNFNRNPEPLAESYVDIRE